MILLLSLYSAWKGLYNLNPLAEDRYFFSTVSAQGSTKMLKVGLHCLRILFAILGLLFCWSKTCFALQQYTKLWMGASVQQLHGADKKWLSFLYTQARLTNNSHPWQAMLFEAGLGYQLFPESNVWLGYRWTGHNPANSFFQENRLFEQVIYDKKLESSTRLILRSRLEEIQLVNAAPIAWRLRERLAFALHHHLFHNAFPYLYDEVFFQLNHTSFTPRTFIGMNRLFLGFNWFHTKNTWWEIGYINQYQIRTPQQTENQMSHIASVTYNIL